MFCCEAGLALRAGMMHNIVMNQISVGTQHSISTLAMNGWSYRRIANELGIHRETVGRYAERATASRARQAAGSLGILNPKLMQWQIKSRLGRHSQCERWREVIEEKMKIGLSCRRVHQDLRRELGFRGGYDSVKRFVHKLMPTSYGQTYQGRLAAKHGTAHEWMRLVAQGVIGKVQIQRDVGKSLDEDSIKQLVKYVLTRPLKLRNRALALLAHAKGISIRDTAAFLGTCRGTIGVYVRAFTEGGIQGALNRSRKGVRRADDPTYSQAVFKVLHTPPSVFGFNRTTWRMSDLHLALEREGFRIGCPNIRMIIRKAGYKFRKAKKVLTSTDPDYREKLKQITGVLQSLQPDEKFFSIDEFGPFAVKIQGGRALAKNSEIRTVPQYQKSKGSLIVTGALELSTNQVVHFYSAKKNTVEMVRMLDLLLEQYCNERRIYLSWDAASWHVSKRFIKRVNEVNASEYRIQHKTPEVGLAPLPACAQFLNVIESVFSGMARAIIHNSDYQSVEECKIAIDRHFAERNNHFQKNPKRAGDKIWGKERVVPEFNPSNNCKDPRW
jgi:transposase